MRFTTIMPGVVDTPILDNRPEPPGAELRARMLHPRTSRPPACSRSPCRPRAHVPELTILPTDLQALGRTA